MSTRKLSQVNFFNGQYDRELQAKEQSEYVSSGFASGVNVLSSEKGELRKRLGTKFLMSLDSESIIIPYRYLGDDIILVFSDGYFKGYKFNDLGELTPLYSNLPVTPLDMTWTGNNTNNYIVNSADANPLNIWKGFNNYVFLSNPWNTGANWYQQSGTPWLLQTYWVTLTFPTPQILSKIRVYFDRYVHNTITDANLYCRGFEECIIQHSDDGGNTWISNRTEIFNPDSLQIRGVKKELLNRNIVVSGFPYPNTKDARLSYDAIQDNNTPHSMYRFYFAQRVGQNVGAASNADCYVLIKPYTTTLGDVVISPHQFPVSSLKNIKYSQENNDMKIVCKGLQPKTFSLNSGIMTFNDYNPLHPSDFFTTYGFPSSVEHFQNRLWFAGFDVVPTTAMGSKFGDYTRFQNETSTIQYTDYLNLKCNQLKSQITNIKAGQNVLYCFSNDGISFIDGGNTGLVATNQNIEFNLKNKTPAGDMAPTIKDDVMFYSSADGNKLYAVDYDLIVSRFISNDMANNAQAVIKDKITEIHFVDDNSKLIYGLTEQDNMFAYLFKKGAMSGMFPLSIKDGFVYDIAVIKIGRDYKLLMVTNRNGSWYLEEKLKSGNYIDTEAFDITDDGRKWATWDNLENNIAMDCRQYYENALNLNGQYNPDNNPQTMVINDSGGYNLTPYLGKQIRLVKDNNNWIVVNLIARTNNNNYQVSVDSRRGSDNLFLKIQLPFQQWPSNFIQGSDVAVISSGQYLGRQVVDANGNCNVQYPIFYAIFGYYYDAYAVIKTETPYESMKTVSQIDLSVMDTMHLEVGTALPYMHRLEEINDQSHYDLTNPTINGIFRIVPNDTPEWSKNIIIKSSEALPFTVTRVDAIINYGDMGGN